MSEEPYEQTVYPNQIAHFDNSIKDALRIGSFVVLKKKGIDYVGRLECRQWDEEEENKWDIRIRLFHPLFKKPNDPSKYKPPSHSFTSLLHGPGANQVELYESQDLCWISYTTNPAKLSFLFPAFVFTISKLSQPKNAWASGLYNVYIVRYWEDHKYENGYKTRILRPLPDNANFGFANDHPDYIKPTTSIVPRRCLHTSIWNGLYGLQKGLSKLLNKRSGQASEKEVLSLSIGRLPMEAIHYIIVVANYLSSIDTHPINLSESFFHLDQNLRRSKIKISFNAAIGFLVNAKLD